MLLIIQLLKYINCTLIENEHSRESINDICHKKDTSFDGTVKKSDQTFEDQRSDHSIEQSEISEDSTYDQEKYLNETSDEEFLRLEKEMGITMDSDCSDDKCSDEFDQRFLTNGNLFPALKRYRSVPNDLSNKSDENNSSDNHISQLRSEIGLNYDPSVELMFPYPIESAPLNRLTKFGSEDSYFEEIEPFYDLEQSGLSTITEVTEPSDFSSTNEQKDSTARDSSQENTDTSDDFDYDITTSRFVNQNDSIEQIEDLPTLDQIQKHPPILGENNQEYAQIDVITAKNQLDEKNTEQISIDNLVYYTIHDSDDELNDNSSEHIYENLNELEIKQNPTNEPERPEETNPSEKMRENIENVQNLEETTLQNSNLRPMSEDDNKFESISLIGSQSSNGDEISGAKTEGLSSWLQKTLNLFKFNRKKSDQKIKSSCDSKILTENTIGHEISEKNDKNQVKDQKSSSLKKFKSFFTISDKSPSAEKFDTNSENDDVVRRKKTRKPRVASIGNFFRRSFYGKDSEQNTDDLTRPRSKVFDIFGRECGKSNSLDFIGRVKKPQIGYIIELNVCDNNEGQLVNVHDILNPEGRCLDISEKESETTTTANPIDQEEHKKQENIQFLKFLYQILQIARTTNCFNQFLLKNCNNNQAENIAQFIQKFEWLSKSCDYKMILECFSKAIATAEFDDLFVEGRTQNSTINKLKAIYTLYSMPEQPNDITERVEKVKLQIQNVMNSLIISESKNGFAPTDFIFGDASIKEYLFKMFEAVKYDPENRSKSSFSGFVSNTNEIESQNGSSQKYADVKKKSEYFDSNVLNEAIILDEPGPCDLNVIKKSEISQKKLDSKKSDHLITKNFPILLSTQFERLNNFYILENYVLPSCILNYPRIFLVNFAFKREILNELTSGLQNFKINSKLYQCKCVIFVRKHDLRFFKLFNNNLVNQNGYKVTDFSEYNENSMLLLVEHVGELLH